MVSGIRVLGESQEIQKQSGKLVFVDAPQEVRYERIKARAKLGDRVHYVPTSLEEFISSEQSELNGEGGPERPNLRAIEKIADIIIQNDATKDEYLERLDLSQGLKIYQ